MCFSNSHSAHHQEIFCDLVFMGFHLNWKHQSWSKRSNSMCDKCRASRIGHKSHGIVEKSLEAMRIREATAKEQGLSDQRHFLGEVSMSINIRCRSETYFWPGWGLVERESMIIKEHQWGEKQVVIC